MIKYILIVLFFTSILAAKSDDTCYSIQLKSFSLKNSKNFDFNKNDYDESCEYITFTNSKAIRCGCYDRYVEAVEESLKFEEKFPEHSLVETRKTRFSSQNLVKTEEPLEIEKSKEIHLDISTPPRLNIEHSKKETCYSIQLKSFSLKNSKNFDFNKNDYDESCEYITFTNSKAVRCGCYETYAQTKEESQKFKEDFPRYSIVETRKTRFSSQNTVKTEESLELAQVADHTDSNFIEEKQLPKPVEPSTLEKPLALVKAKEPVNYNFIEEGETEDTIVPLDIEETIELTQAPEQTSYSFMEDTKIQGHLDLTSQYYIKAPEDKHKYNISAAAELDAEYAKDAIKLKTKLKAQQDYFDFKGDDDATNRSFVRVDELYATYDFADDQILIGKNILFWGALEVRNIADTFNSTELRDDPFDSDKLGSWNISYRHYTENGEFSAIVKLYEQSRQMSAYPYVYYYFPQNINVSEDTQAPLVYNDKLITEGSKTNPSIYLKYSASTETDYPLDYAIIFQNGYDSQRYYTNTPAADGSSVKTAENAYMVNKLSVFNTLVIDATLLKLEAVYTDVIDNEVISDYFHLGVGFEYTLNQVYGDASLGLLSEYYYYKLFDSDKRNDLELFELFQNDIFFGARYSFNKGYDASIIGGAILDLDYNEQVYYIEYESRVAESFKVNFDYRFISPAKDDKTAFNLMGEHERISLKMGYYF